MSAQQPADTRPHEQQSNADILNIAQAQWKRSKQVKAEAQMPYIAEGRTHELMLGSSQERTQAPMEGTGQIRASIPFSGQVRAQTPRPSGGQLRTQTPRPSGGQVRAQTPRPSGGQVRPQTPRPRGGQVRAQTPRPSGGQVRAHALMSGQGQVRAQTLMSGQGQVRAQALMSGQGQLRAQALMSGQGQVRAQALMSGQGQVRAQALMSEHGQVRAKPPTQINGQGRANAKKTSSGQGRKQSLGQGRGKGRGQALPQESGPAKAQPLTQDCGQAGAQASISDRGQMIVQAPTQSSGQDTAPTLTQDSEEMRAQTLIPDSGQVRAQALVSGHGQVRAKPPTQRNGQGRAKAEKTSSGQGRKQSLGQGRGKGRGQALPQESGPVRAQQQDSGQVGAQGSIADSGQMIAQAPTQDSGQGRAKALAQDSEEMRAQTSIPESGQVRAQALMSGHGQVRAKPPTQRNGQGRAKAKQTSSGQRSKQSQRQQDSGQGRAKALKQDSEVMHMRAQTSIPDSGQVRVQALIPDINRPATDTPPRENVSSGSVPGPSNQMKSGGPRESEAIKSKCTALESAQTPVQDSGQGRTQVAMQAKKRISAQTPQQGKKRKRSPESEPHNPAKRPATESIITGPGSRKIPRVEAEPSKPVENVCSASVPGPSRQTESGKSGGSESVKSEPTAGPSKLNIEHGTETSEIARSSAGPWNFTCLLANLGGDKRSSNKPVKHMSHAPKSEEPKSGGCKPVEPKCGPSKPLAKQKNLTRKKQLQSILNSGPDVMLFQETEDPGKIWSNLKRTSLTMHESESKVAVVLKKSKFGAVEHFTESYLKSLLGSDVPLLDTYTEMVRNKHMRIGLHKVVHTESKESVLIASYHGRVFAETTDGPKRKKVKISDREYCKIYADLLKICHHLQTEMGAKHMLIGGDFNVSDVVFEPMIRHNKLPLTIHTQTNTTARRGHKDVIDFFIASKDIKCKSMTAQPAITGVDYLQLESHLDHDLIRAEFTMHSEASSKTEESSDTLTTIIQEMALGGESMKAYECAVNQLHQTHMEALIATLKNKNPKKWEGFKYNDLFDHLKSESKLALAKKFAKDDLKLILQCLKVPFPPMAQKDELVRLLCQVYS